LFFLGEQWIILPFQDILFLSSNMNAYFTYFLIHVYHNLFSHFACKKIISICPFSLSISYIFYLVAYKKITNSNLSVHFLNFLCSCIYEDNKQ
jgi:hypothetical protein